MALLTDDQLSVMTRRQKGLAIRDILLAQGFSSENANNFLRLLATVLAELDNEFGGKF